MEMSDIPEIENMWKEKVEVEETEDQTKDPFIPAKLAEPSKPEDVLVRIEL